MTDLILVEWLDHCSWSGGPWSTLKDLKDLKPQVITSVGYLVVEEETYITIASTVGDDMYSGDTCILKSCITKRRKLK